MIMQSTVLRFAVSSITWLCFVSCASPSDQSEAKITNGKATEAYPAVVKIDIKSGERETYCTGTFLSKTVVLTASHCFFTASDDDVRFGQVKAISYQRHPNFEFHVPGISGLDATEIDLALVKFPEGTSKVFLSLTKKPLNPGSPAIVVGYGRHQLENAEDLSYKQEGRTLVQDHRDGRYFIEGSDGVLRQAESRRVYPNEKYSSIAPGDSGGPLLTEDGRSILGVASWVSTSTDKVGVASGIFNDVLGQQSQAFLREFLKKYGM